MLLLPFCQKAIKCRLNSVTCLRAIQNVNYHLQCFSLCSNPRTIHHLLVPETLISHHSWLFNVDVLSSPVKFKAWFWTTTVLMHLKKFWLHWLWQRIMSGFEDFKNILGIRNCFSPHKVYFQENLTVLKKLSLCWTSTELIKNESSDLSKLLKSWQDENLRKKK